MGLCLAVLGWALLTVVGGVTATDGSPRVDAVVGAAAAVLGAAVLGRELRRRAADPADRQGSRARSSGPGRRRAGGAHAG